MMERVLVATQQRTEVVQARAAVVGERDGKKQQRTTKYEGDQRSLKQVYETDIQQVGTAVCLHVCVLIVVCACVFFYFCVCACVCVYVCLCSRCFVVVAVRTVADRVVRPLVRVPLHTSYACDAYTYTRACTTHFISLPPPIQIDDQYAPTLAALDEQLQKVTVVYDFTPPRPFGKI